MARGGRRIGAGRKPNRLQVVTGSFDSRSAEGAETVIPVPPAGLSGEAAAVWRELAPLAVERQTLNRSTMLAFAMLCRNIVLEQALAADPSLVGGANHRGMLQRVETELAHRGRAAATDTGSTVARRHTSTRVPFPP